MLSRFLSTIHSATRMEKVREVVIIGSGPAAHTAAIYTGRARLRPLLFEGQVHEIAM